MIFLGKTSKSLSKYFSGSLAQKLAARVSKKIPAQIKDTFLLRGLGFLKIPLLFFVSPSVLEASEDRCVVRVALNRRTQNHLKSMYFGVLAVGADCAGGLIAFKQIHADGNRVSLIFKDFHARFLKRAEGDVLFTCNQGREIRELVHKASESDQRENMSVRVIATVPSRFGDEPVAEFILTLSLKREG